MGLAKAAARSRVKDNLLYSKINTQDDLDNDGQGSVTVSSSIEGSSRSPNKNNNHLIFGPRQIQNEAGRLNRPSSESGAVVLTRPNRSTTSSRSAPGPESLRDSEAECVNGCANEEEDVVDDGSDLRNLTNSNSDGGGSSSSLSSNTATTMTGSSRSEGPGGLGGAVFSCTTRDSAAAAAQKKSKKEKKNKDGE